MAGGPTGTVFNTTAGFNLPTGGKGLFLFDGEDGIVRAWNGAQGTTAIILANMTAGGQVHAIRRESPSEQSLGESLIADAVRMLFG